MPSPAVLPAKVPYTEVLILAAFSANLGLSILSPVITILRDDFSASADRAQLVLCGSVIFIIGGIGALLSTTIDMLIGFGACHCECDNLQHACRWTQ